MSKRRVQVMDEGLLIFGGCGSSRRACERGRLQTPSTHHLGHRTRRPADIAVQALASGIFFYSFSSLSFSFPCSSSVFLVPFVIHRYFGVYYANPISDLHPSFLFASYSTWVGALEQQLRRITTNYEICIWTQFLYN
jgi:hypothetical protein